MDKEQPQIFLYKKVVCFVGFFLGLRNEPSPYDLCLTNFLDLPGHPPAGLCDLRVGGHEDEGHGKQSEHEAGEVHSDECTSSEKELMHLRENGWAFILESWDVFKMRLVIFLFQAISIRMEKAALNTLS